MYTYILVRCSLRSKSLQLLFAAVAVNDFALACFLARRKPMFDCAEHNLLSCSINGTACLQEGCPVLSWNDEVIFLARTSHTQAISGGCMLTEQLRTLLAGGQLVLFELLCTGWICCWSYLTRKTLQVSLL